MPRWALTVDQYQEIERLRAAELAIREIMRNCVSHGLAHAAPLARIIYPLAPVAWSSALVMRGPQAPVAFGHLVRFSELTDASVS
jgi:hypothetical protein